MSSHENRSQGPMDRRGRNLVAHLFDVDIERIESLSWSLGNQIIAEGDTDQRFRFDHQRSTRSVTAFEVTDYTCVLRLRTPVGREKFYGVASADVEPNLIATDWVRTA